MSCSTSICIVSPMRLVTKTMFSTSSNSCSSLVGLEALKCPLYLRLSQVGSCNFTPWNGLRYLGISISPKHIKNGKNGKCRGKGVYASLFGVGAPEALVIGVVALLVFGPKGLAEVARNLGKTLRAFQPTIKELQDVSKEFKNTLEREIGLDDDPRSMRNPYESNTPRSTATSSSSVVEDFQNVPEADPNGKAYSSEEYLKITEEQQKAYAAAQQNVALQESQNEPLSQPLAEPTVASSSLESPPEPESQPQASEQDGVPSPSESMIDSESQTEGDVGTEAIWIKWYDGNGSCEFAEGLSGL